MLGSPAIYWVGEPYKIQRRILRSMMYFLGYTRRLVSRNALILSFWPEASEEDGRRHLRETLSKLKAQLPDPNILITDQDRVGLNFSMLRVDAHEFMAIASHTNLVLQQHADPVLPALVVQDILDALKIWRGPDFLSGANLPESEDFERWMQDTRRELGNIKQYLIARLAGHYFASNSLLEALHWLQEALAADDLNVNLHIQILETLHRLGQTTEALEHYKRLVKIYREEGLGELPPEANQIHQKLIKREATPKESTNLYWFSSLDLRIPFAGRKEIVDTLTSACQNGGAAIIFGEPGAGKTRLLYEVYRSLSPQPRLLISSGKLMERAIPFQPWVDLFRQCLTKEDFQGLDASWLQALWMLLPELAPAGKNRTKNPALLDTQDRSYFFEAIHQILLSLSKRERIFLCLDDAQWCDDATFSSLSYLQTRGFFDKYGFLLVNCRQGDSTTALDEFLKSRVRLSNTKVIHLPQLEQEDIRVISRAVLGISPSREFVSRLFLETGGNPLFLLKTLRAIQQVSTDSHQLDNLESLPIPPSIEDLIHARVSALKSDAQKLLITAAVMGNKIDTNLAAKTSKLGLQKTVSALEQLEAVHLIKPVPESSEEGDYVFIHEQVRTILLRELSPARRKLLHQNTAEVLEEQAGGMPRFAELLANHFQDAGDMVKAVHYWVEAGIYANHILLPEQAFSDYKKAEALVDSHDGLIPVQLIYKLYDSFFNHYSISSNREKMREIAQKMLQSGRKRSSSLLIGTALSNLALAESMTLSTQKGIQYLMEAQPYIDQADNLKEKAEFYSRMALLNLIGLKFQDAKDNFQKAFEYCKDASEPDLVQVRINTNMRLALLYFWLGFPKKEEQSADLIFRDCETIGDVPNAGKALFLKGHVKLLDEQYTEAISITKRSIEIIKAQNNMQFYGYVILNLAQIYQYKGDIDEAYEQYQEVFSLIKPGEFNDVLAETHVNLGAFYLNLSAFEKAQKVYQHGLDLAGAMIQKFILKIGLAQSLAGLGQLENAENILNPVIEQTQLLSLDSANLRARICRGRIAMLKGDFGQARKDLEWARNEANERGFHTAVAVVNFFLGNLLLSQNLPEEAHEYASKYFGKIVNLQNPWSEISSLRLKSKAIRMMGEKDDSLKEQVKVLLSHLEKNCTTPLLVPLFKNFKQIVLADFK